MMMSTSVWDDAIHLQHVCDFIIHTFHYSYFPLEICTDMLVHYLIRALYPYDDAGNND